MVGICELLQKNSKEITACERDVVVFVHAFILVLIVCFLACCPQNQCNERKKIRPDFTTYDIVVCFSNWEKCGSGSGDGDDDIITHRADGTKYVGDYDGG